MWTLRKPPVVLYIYDFFQSMHFDHRYIKIVISFVLITSGNQLLGHKKDSRMLIANAHALDDSLKYYSDIFNAPEIYVWTGKSLKQLE